MLPVASAAMPTVSVMAVAEPGPGAGQSQSQSQAETAEARSGGGGENTNWAPETKHKPVMGATTVFACAFLHSL